MARVVLVIPPLPQRLGTPYLGQQYVGASLRAAGHDVAVVDGAAAAADADEDEVVAAVERHAPTVVGFTLFTYNAAAGYRIAGRLRDGARVLVAGGPHATVRPAEALNRGFDYVVAGEGETLAARIASSVARGTPPAPAPGLHGAGAGSALTGEVAPGTAVHEDLDALPYPATCADAWDPAWYGDAGLRVSGGVVTSRGCPARCTFCANYVTGRVCRTRSPANVVAELVALRERHGLWHTPFWDDAFTARPERVLALCRAIRAEPRLAGFTWSCITPGSMVRPPLLAEMRAAGCVAINFGLESGDPRILAAIRKGQRPERVEEAVRAAREAGMRTVVNFMFGFPGEGTDELANTFRAMERLAPVTDYFSPHGVLVPFPGTEIYDRHHARYGFTDWWLDPTRVPRAAAPPGGDDDAVQAWLARDPALDSDFFHYSDAVRDQIGECVRFKAEHNRRALHGRTAQGRTAQGRTAQGRTE